MKKCLIIFPPQCRPFHPQLGPAMLKAALTAAGHACKILDLNLLWYRKILTRPALEFAQASISQAVVALDGRAIQGAEAVKYKRCACALLRSGYVIEHIEQAIDSLKSANFYQIKNFVWALKVLEEALDLYSAQFECLELGLSQLRTKFSTASSAALIFATTDAAANPFMGDLIRLILPVMEEYRPDVIGLSIMLDEQLIPSLTLAKELRQVWPGPVVAGGAMMTRLSGVIDQSEFSRQWFDRCFFYESETSLVEYMNVLDGKQEWSGVPSFEHIKPDFSDYCLDDYLLPQRVLPYQGTRGCSFGRCRYCSHYKTYGTFLKGDPVKAAQILHELSGEYNVKHFYLLDEALEPQYAKLFCAELLRIGADIRFMVFARSRRGWTEEIITIIAKAGCRRLIFGVDALTARVQTLMDKNIDLEHTRKIMKWCASVGISLQINVVVGYPGETLEEAMNSLLFVEENKNELTTIGSSFAYTPFYLVKGADWGNIPVTPVASPNKDFAICFKYAIEQGITMQENRRIAMDLQRKTDEILNASRRYPLLREFAFLYTDHACSVEPIELERGNSAPWPTVPKKHERWLRHDLDQAIKHFDLVFNGLSETENDYVSISWRVAEEGSFSFDESNRLNLHRMHVAHHEKTIEMPIQRMLTI